MVPLWNREFLLCSVEAIFLAGDFQNMTKLYPVVLQIHMHGQRVTEVRVYYTIKPHICQSTERLDIIWVIFF